jgi:hypothetical protein
MHLEDFPMDAHSCPLKFGSCKYNSKHTYFELITSPGDSISVGSCSFFFSYYAGLHNKLIGCRSISYGVVLWELIL